jgi:hypothetical protein
VTSHDRLTAANGAALTHGFTVAFWVLAVLAAAGAVIAGLMLESQPPAAAAPKPEVARAEALGPGSAACLRRLQTQPEHERAT